MEGQMIYAFRHPFVEGEGTGSATDARSEDNSLSEKGMLMVDTIIFFLRCIPMQPTTVVTSSLPRYMKMAVAIASAFNIPIWIEERLGQVGERMVAGEERVRKFNDVHLPNMLSILASAPDKAVIVTSNPLLECLQYQKRPITLQEMETEGGKKKYRVNPGCGLCLESGGTVFGRMDIFDKDGNAWRRD